ncbi:HNH endonuclease [Leptospira idonii]|uniref:HNH endonuclease n=1 Tax=Leptospira idonii TaxID=1193500 RepID=UPI00143835D0|nr:HNH endonuclease [Leptospira idonii]
MPVSDHTHKSSNEHIFPKSIGGKLKAKNLLCQKHNSLFGHSIDATLEKAFLPYCIMLGVNQISNRNEKHFIANIGNRKIKVYANGRTELAKPSLNSTIDETTGIEQIQIEAPNEKYLNQLLSQLKKDRPNLKSQVKTENKYNVRIDTIDYQPSFKIPFFDKDIHRSICKTLANYWIYSGKPKDSIKPLIQYILDQNLLPIVPFYNTEIILTKPNKAILNSLVIVGCSHLKKLVGYVELLDAYRVIIQIDSNYSDLDFCLHFSENVFTNENFNNLQINHQALLDFNDYHLKAELLEETKISKGFARFAYFAKQKADFYQLVNLYKYSIRQSHSSNFY